MIKIYTAEYQKRRQKIRERNSRPETRAKIRKWSNERKIRLKAIGVCPVCGTRQAKDGRILCSECLQKAVSNTRKQIQSNIDAGVCGRCGHGHPLASSRKDMLCETCYFKRVSRGRFGTSRFWRILKLKLEEQRYTCAYSGVKLIPFVNASVDHIKPLKHFPELRGDPNNVEWVTREINEMKRDRTPEEFMSIIRTITVYRESK